jgi:hypothetical protein
MSDVRRFLLELVEIGIPADFWDSDCGKFPTGIPIPTNPIF